MKIRTVIIDDGHHNIDCLIRDLATWPQMEVIGAETSPEAGQRLVLREKPDVLFLDMMMPGKSGLQLLEDICGQAPDGMRIVFYTAYSGFMLDAIRNSAFDFLLKPYTREELSVVVNRILADFSSAAQVKESPRESFSRLFDGGERFAVLTTTGVALIGVEEAVCFRFSKDGGRWAVTTSKRCEYEMNARTGASDILALSDKYVQTSKDCIINSSYLSSIDNSTMRCRLRPPYNDMEIYASRRHFSKLRSLIQTI